jgi:hypothetical protein
MSLAKSRVRVHRAARLSMKVARLSTFCSAVAVVVAALVARSVHAAAAESIYELDRQFARQAGAMDRQSYRVRLNGQSMMISSHMVDASVHDVLQAADDECRAHSGNLQGDLAKLPGAAMARLTSWVFGVARQEWADQGYVACIQRDGDTGVAGLGAGLRAFVATGDIARLGTFRYVVVDRAAGTTKTHVLRQWTEGSFELTKMFPAQGDVPGSDLKEAPRPEGSRRVLDASVDGSTFGVRVYDAPEAPAAVLARYEQQLVAQGWTSVVLPEKDAATTRVFDLGAADLFITASPVGERSVVSIADMPPSRN